MSAIKRAVEDIRALLEEGYRPVTIAGMLDVSVDLVYAVAETAALAEVDSYS
jgi:hypothetical protein